MAARPRNPRVNMNGISTIKVESPEPSDEGQPAVKPSPGLHLRALHPTDLRPLKEALEADHAEMVAPTHVLERQGRIVGYGSAGKVRLLAGWTAPAVDDPDSLTALKLLEQAAAAEGAKIIVVACSPECRFKPMMTGAGYQPGRDVTLYFKKVR